MGIDTNVYKTLHHFKIDFYIFFDSIWRLRLFAIISDYSMKLSVNFTPGPSQLYFTIQDHVRLAFREGIPSLSHRSKQFEKIYQNVMEGLSQMLNLSSDYHIFFTGSATEIWERSIQNLVEKKSFHFVNGAFSKRFYEIAKQLHKGSTKIEVEIGTGFEEPVSFPNETELIGLTHNETSTGVSLPINFISSIKDTNPDLLIVVDAVSSLPYPDFDYSKIDSVFFSVQKAFGLPAGLGVWMVNDRCIAKAEKLLSKGISIGSYHSILSLHEYSKKNQTPETPNVLGIYLLSKVIDDFNRRGIQQIRKETEYKAAILYQCLSNHPTIKPFVKNSTWQSRTVIVADCGIHTQKLVDHLNRSGLSPGDGYGTMKSSQLRFANFPAHSKEQFELLVDNLNNFQP
ncbi:MAG: aminotransferase class V-fold PLP-dependent enzyme [Flammeovirgaceae bacterium]|nr:aminotransferase class V-fold PLP-dependent enzyme [Flammeovirgaceae bacterium]